MSEKSSTINSVSYASAVEELQYPISETDKTACVLDETMPIHKIGNDWYNKSEEKIKNKKLISKEDFLRNKNHKKIVYSLDELYNIKTKCFVNPANDPPLKFMAGVFQFWSFKFSIKPSSMPPDEYQASKYNNQNIPIFFEHDKFRDLQNKYRNRNNAPLKNKSKHENKRHLAKDITNKASEEENYVFQLKKDTKRNNQHHVKYVNHYDAHTTPSDDISVIFPTSPPPKNEEFQSWANTNMQNPFLFNFKTQPSSNF